MRRPYAAILLALSLSACAELDVEAPDAPQVRKPSIAVPTLPPVKAPKLPQVTLPPLPTVPPSRRPATQPPPATSRPPSARPPATTRPSPSRAAAPPTRDTGGGGGDVGSGDEIDARNAGGGRGSWDWSGFDGFAEAFAAMLAGFVCAMFALVAMIGLSLVAMTFAFAAAIVGMVFASLFGPVAGFGAFVVALVLLAAVGLRRRAT